MAKKGGNGFKLFLLAFLATAFGGCAVEAGVRLLPGAVGFDEKIYDKLCAFARGENPTPYEGRAHTIYRLKAQPGVNSLGFADRPWRVNRKPGIPRIACLGGSTTQDGLGADRPTYPRHLETVLKNRLGCDVETMNFGIDGWTSAETMTNYFLNVVDYKPDMVIIQHAVNDVWPRIWPNYKTDYSHYRTPYRKLEFESLDGFFFRLSKAYALIKMKSWGAHDLSSRNTQPVENRTEVLANAERTPQTLQGFRQNLRAIIDHASARGTSVILVTIKVNPKAYEHFMKRQPKIMQQLIDGSEECNNVLRQLASETDAVLVDISRTWENDDFETNHLPNYHDGFVHVNGKGNRNKALLLADTIVSQKLLSCDE